MRYVFLLPLCVIALARPASADTVSKIADLASRAADKLDQYGLDNKIADAVARAAVGRARRAIAIGPHIGAFEQIDAKDSATGFGLSFGLGLYTFEVPLGLRLREVIKARVKDELRARIASGDPNVDGEQMIRDIIEKVVHDVLEGGYGSQTWQAPKLSIVLEGQKTLGDADGFGARLFAGYGVSKLSLGLSASVMHAGDTTTALFGPELALRLTPIGEMRTPVFDVFARVEIGARSTAPVAGAVGLRLLLDVL
jgi:hypothetical protein